jgi:hypothetical protein
VAARLLESYLGGPIVVTGGVELGYGTTNTVAAHGVTPIRPAAQLTTWVAAQISGFDVSGIGFAKAA